MHCLILLEDEVSHLNLKNFFCLGKEVAMSLGDTEIIQKTKLSLRKRVKMNSSFYL